MQSPPSNSPSDRPRTLRWAVIVLVAVGIVAIWKIRPAPDQRPTVVSRATDAFMYSVPLREYGFQTLRAGKVPLWNPYLLGGQPYLAVHQVALLYPGSWPHLLLPTESALAVIVVSHMIWGALGAYVWFRRLGLPPPACAVGAVAFALASNVVGELQWFPIATATSWLPWICAGIEAVVARPTPRRTALLGGACACLLLTGAMQIGLYIYYVALPYALLRWWRESRGRRARTAVALGVGLAVLPACITAVQLVPTWELALHSPRTVGGLQPEAVAQFGHVPLRIILGGLLGYSGGGTAGFLFVPSLVAGLLLVAACASPRRRGLVAFWVGAGLLATVLAGGFDTPLYRIYFRLPTGDLFRHPVHFLIIPAAAAALCAAVGVEHLGREPARGGASRASRWRVVPYIIAGLVLTVAARAWLAGALATGLVVAWMVRPRRQPVWALAAGALIVAHAAATIRPAEYLPWQGPSPFAVHADVAAFLRQRLGHDRFHLYREPRGWKNWSFPANWGVTQRLRQLTGYEALTLQRVADSFAYMESGRPSGTAVPFIGGLDLTPGAAHPNWLNRWSVRWIVVDAGENRWPQGNPPVSARWLQDRLGLEAVDVGGTRLLYNPHALPRAYGVARARAVPAGRRVWDALADPRFDPTREVLLDDDEATPDAPDAAAPLAVSVTFLRDEPERVELAVEANAAHWLVLTDAWFPGWRATIDGAPTDIRRANGVFRAVRVPAGSHVVRFRYRPASVRYTAVLSLFGLVALGGGLLHRPRH